MTKTQELDEYLEHLGIGLNKPAFRYVDMEGDESIPEMLLVEATWCDGDVTVFYCHNQIDSVFWDLDQIADPKAAERIRIVDADHYLTNGTPGFVNNDEFWANGYTQVEGT